MSYVDAFHDTNKDKVFVVERVDGKRYYKTYPTRYIFYYNDPNGDYKSIHGNRVSRFSTKLVKEFDRERKIYSHQKLYESDINPIFRCLEDNYINTTSPDFNLSFLSPLDTQSKSIPSSDFKESTITFSFFLYLISLLTSLFSTSKIKIE